MAGLGWLGVTIPKRYGGFGGDMLDACLFMEETSRGTARWEAAGIIAKTIGL
jgi:alkylation response protein AidB-like acyl-CoA dehydrogenase